MKLHRSCFFSCFFVFVFGFEKVLTDNFGMEEMEMVSTFAVVLFSSILQTTPLPISLQIVMGRGYFINNDSERLEW